VGLEGNDDSGGIFDASAQELKDSLIYVPIDICMYFWCLTMTIIPSFFDGRFEVP